MLKYTSILLLGIAIGCGTTDTGSKTKTLNTSNLQRTNYGTYRLVSIKDKAPSVNKGATYVNENIVTEVDKVPNGLTYTPPTEIKERNIVNISSSAILTPKQKAEANDRKVVSNSSTEGIVPITITPEPNKPLVKINWGGLVFFYMLAGLFIVLGWIGWNTYKQYRQKVTNPFIAKDEQKVKPQPKKKRNSKK